MVELPASAEAALAALNKIATWDRATYTEWSNAARQPKTTFERNVGRLTAGEYVAKASDEQEISRSALDRRRKNH